MSKQKDILSSELLRARIIEIEYRGLDENTIRRIYMEEIGEPLDANIDIYYSEDFINEKESNRFNIKEKIQFKYFSNSLNSMYYLKTSR